VLRGPAALFQLLRSLAGLERLWYLVASFKDKTKLEAKTKADFYYLIYAAVQIACDI